MRSLVLLRRSSPLLTMSLSLRCTNASCDMTWPNIQVVSRAMSTDWESTHHAQGSSQPVINEDKITLFNMRFCPFAERTVLVLLAKNIPFDNINVNLKEKPDWFLENTFGKVPVMLLKGKRIPESLITCDLLDEMYPEPKLHPNSPVQKALDRILVEKVCGLMKFLYPIFAYIPNRTITSEEKKELFKSLVEHLASFEEELKSRGTKYVCGKEAGMADYMIWPLFERIEGLPLLLSDISKDVTLPSHMVNILEWMKAMRETGPVEQYGFSPARMAKITKIHNETGGYDDALQSSLGS